MLTRLSATIIGKIDPRLSKKKKGELSNQASGLLGVRAIHRLEIHCRPIQRRDQSHKDSQT